MIIYRCINSPFHDGIKIDGINGYDKTYLKQKMCMMVTEESNDKSTIINASSMICDKNQ